MGVGSEAWGGDLGRDRSLRLRPPRPGGDRDQVPSPAASEWVWAWRWEGEPQGVCRPRSLHSQCGSGWAPPDEPALEAEVKT